METVTEDILLDLRNELSDILGTQFWEDHASLEAAKAELEIVQERLQTLLNTLDGLVQVVAVEECFGHGEALHPKSATLNGRCLVCGTMNTTVVYLLKDKK